jgi:hypothetical protein
MDFKTMKQVRKKIDGTNFFILQQTNKGGLKNISGPVAKNGL